jgi:hypothetical protein
MSSKATAALVILAFASGGASGFVVGRSALATRGAVEVQTWDDVLAGLTRECGLSADQRTKFDQIRNQYHPRAVAVKQSFAGDLATIRSDVRGAMRAILDDGQKRLFDDWCRRRDASREREDR